MNTPRFKAWHKEAKEFCEGTTSNMFAWIDQGQPIVLLQFTGIIRGTLQVWEGDIFYVAGTGNCVVSLDPYLGTMFISEDGEESSWIDELAEDNIGRYLGNTFWDSGLMDIDFEDIKNV